jgi:protoheme IX farnesyltransferase
LRDEYAKVNIPMLPVTHGTEFTRLHILLYTILLFIVTLLPYLTGMSGLIYVIPGSLLSLGFIYFAIKMAHQPSNGGAAPAAPPITIFCGVMRLRYTV